MARRCREDDCDKWARARGMCRTHYDRFMRHGDPRKVLENGRRYVRQHEGCKLDGCPEPHHAKGYCNTHFHRWKAHGDPTIVLPTGRKPWKVMP